MPDLSQSAQPLSPVIRLSHALVIGWFNALLVFPTLSRAAAPDWAADAVWYQIFPERFRNGDPANDPARDSLELPLAPSEKWRVSRWTADWYARDEWERELGPNFYWHVADRRYGGDLQGVIDQLDYLADLGINALYFNPVFAARSAHKYDGDTLHHIDPHFGPDPAGDRALIARETFDPQTWQWTAADRLFLDLLKAAHARGMRVIIDGVFNHTGRGFPAFEDLRKNQQRSPFRDWYHVERFDDPATPQNEFRYRGWAGSDRLPEFAETSDDLPAGVKSYIFAATKRWMDPDGDGDPRDGLDGWRLDAADTVPVKFWAEWNAHVRRLNPAACTVAEIWSDAARLIREGGFSAAMNYHAFAYPVKAFLIDNKFAPSRFARLLDLRRAALPPGAAAAMQNLLSSHDTDRLPSKIVNRARARYDGSDNIPFNDDNAAEKHHDYELRAPNDHERRIQKLAVFFQMTTPGAPMIYYGEEAGMWGARDPDCRMPMVWADFKFDPLALDPHGRARPPANVNFDPALHAFYQSVIALRHEHPSLRHGGFVVVLADDSAQSLAFTRDTPAEKLLVILNRSHAAQTLSIPASKTDLSAFGKMRFTTGEEVKFEANHEVWRVVLPALTGAVFGPS
jgi:glycosidase